MPDITFHSWAAGEVGPSYYGRSDQETFFASAKLLYNYVVGQAGNAVGRGGSVYVAAVKSQSVKTLLVPFQFNEEQAYILEFGDHYMRVYKDRATVFEASLNITGATAASPVVLTVNHNLPSGITVQIDGVVGMTQLNGNRYLTEAALAASKNITAAYKTNPVRITIAGSHGYVGGELVFVESVGGMTQLNNRTFELEPVTTSVYSITAISQANPAVVTVSGTHALEDGDTVLIENVVGMTQVNNLRFVTSPKYSATKNVSAVTLANPGVVTTSSNHGFTHGDRIRLESLGGTVQLNDREFLITRSLQGAKTIYQGLRVGPGNVVKIPSTAHGYNTGDRVYFSSVAHAVELNGNEYTITVLDVNNFTLDGTNIANFTLGTETPDTP